MTIIAPLFATKLYTNTNKPKPTKNTSSRLNQSSPNSYLRANSETNQKTSSTLFRYVSNLSSNSPQFLTFANILFIKKKKPNLNYYLNLTLIITCFCPINHLLKFSHSPFYPYPTAFSNHIIYSF